MGFHKRYIGIDQVKVQLVQVGYESLYDLLTTADAVILQDDVSSFVHAICTCGASKPEKLELLKEFCILQFGDIVEC
jgi:hypothetical protein|tara:strand:+ start:318 stop:548 length:231 start_codon:yes stop_codon:yes gene_type:complete